MNEPDKNFERERKKDRGKSYEGSREEKEIDRPASQTLIPAASGAKSTNINKKKKRG